MGKLEGEYIAIFKYGDVPENDVYGKVIDSTDFDGYTKYTLLKADGTTCEVTDQFREVSDYEGYFTHIHSDVYDCQEAIDNSVKVLKELLGEDNFMKALTIADKCSDRLEPYKVGEEVIVFPIEENYFHVAKREIGTVTSVEAADDLKYESYYVHKGFNFPFYIPKYTIETQNGNRCFYGNDWFFNSGFIGTQDEFIRFLVVSIRKYIEEIQTIETIRGELYSEIKDVPGADTRLMRHPIECHDPFGDQMSL